MGLGGVAIVILPSIMCLKLTFSDGLGGGKWQNDKQHNANILYTITTKS